MVCPACLEAQVANVHQLAPLDARRHGHRQFVVALRDLQVANHGVGQRRNAINIRCCWDRIVGRHLAPLACHTCIGRSPAA